MTNLELQLKAWHDENYGSGVDVPATYRKLLEEVGELGESLMLSDPLKVKEEGGDVAVMLFHILREYTGEGINHAMAVALDKVESEEWRRKHANKRKNRK